MINNMKVVLVINTSDPTILAASAHHIQDITVKFATMQFALVILDGGGDCESLYSFI